MRELLFLDSAVIGTFAKLDRVALLTSVLNGRGAWTSAVEYEALHSTTAEDRTILHECLGEPIAIEDSTEIRVIQRLRRVVFGGAQARPLHYLGEAETCFLLSERAEFASSGWLTDNPEILRYAQNRGISARRTRDLMSAAVLDGTLAPEQARSILISIRDLS